MRTRVKICGITRIEDALEAARLGADAIGLLFYPGSPRAVTIDQARHIAAALPPFVTTVGLFVDAEPSAIRAVLEAVPLDLLQFHGDEWPEQCRLYGRPYIKALRMKEGLDLAALAASYSDARGLLLDTYHAGMPGGTGQTFDWARVPMNLPRPLILAGGLNPQNVVTAIRAVHPYGVDVSGGVEAAHGIKDGVKLAAFMRGVDSVQ